MFPVLIHCLPGFELVLLITMPSPTYACPEQGTWRMAGARDPSDNADLRTSPGLAY